MKFRSNHFLFFWLIPQFTIYVLRRGYQSIFKVPNIIAHIFYSCNENYGTCQDNLQSIEKLRIIPVLKNFNK